MSEEIKAQIISGEYGKIIARQKSGKEIELGELMVSETEHQKIIFQVYELLYSSQISDKNLELISGMTLEENHSYEFLDKNLRNYNIACLKPLLAIKNNTTSLCKTLPSFFSFLREINKQDLSFITKPEDSIYFGKLRSGSKIIDVDIFLKGKDVFSHHILIAATTGRGKSNLTSVMLWDSVDKDYCGVLVLDPHDEYFGRTRQGLKDHPNKDKIVYYTSRNAPAGQRTLTFNITNIKPEHFDGALNLTPPQYDLLRIYYKFFGKKWIESIILEKEIEGIHFQEGTLHVVKRKILNILDLEFTNNHLLCHGIFDIKSGMTTHLDIAAELENSKIVIIDTSNLSSSQEILVGSLIASEILRKYQHYKTTGELDSKPVISIVIEEAPRVLGKEVLEKGPNIFSTIAREGRKFKIGLTAITQLPSAIPKDILANINTKIILGVEMANERQAIIDSAAQDLSQDSRNIASLDKGEAIITSTFAHFALPIRIPLFTEFIKEKIYNIQKRNIIFEELRR